MHDGHRADQSDPGPRFRRPRWWRNRWHPRGVRRTFWGRRLATGMVPYDPNLTNFLYDAERMACQPVLHASLGHTVLDMSASMLPAWPWASTDRRKGSRPRHPTAPHADRRRLLKSFGSGRGRVHTGRPGRPDASRTHTLSGASDTSGGDSADGDGSAGSHGVDSTAVVSPSSG
jgi:hypothetical protein